MRQNDGGPAFPTPESHGDDYEGMSLRDYFAAAFIQGLATRDTYNPGQASPTQRAHLAYLEADAMLAERAK